MLKKIIYIIILITITSHLISCSVSNIKDKDVLTMLHAIKSENINALKSLLKKGININTTFDFYDNYPIENSNYLIYAIKKDVNIEVIKYLIANGININHACIIEKTKIRNALHFAVLKSRMDIVKLLVGLGIDINFGEDYGGQTPLFTAACKNENKIAEYLVQQGANPNYQVTLPRIYREFCADGNSRLYTINTINPDLLKIPVGKRINKAIANQNRLALQSYIMKKKKLIRKVVIPKGLRTIFRWYFTSFPGNTNLYWRILSKSIKVKTTQYQLLGTTPYEKIEMFKINGIDSTNAHKVFLEVIAAKKKGYEDQKIKMSIPDIVIKNEIKGVFYLKRIKGE